eukprot:gene24714-4933_t
MSARVDEKGRWTKKQAGGGALSFTQVIKQGAGQRRATLKAHGGELAAVAVQLAEDPVSVALRELAANIAWPFICPANSGQPNPATSPTTVRHVDWGGSTGALSRLLATRCSNDHDARTLQLESKSYDLVPADAAVEPGDHALPPRAADCGKLDVITGVANLENPLDVPGFFAQCIQTLRPGTGVLILVQPLGLAPAAIAVAGAGRVLGMLETMQLRYWDMPLAARGGGPGRAL